MTPGAALTLFLQIATVAGLLLTALRLYLSGIYRRYRFFFSYLIFAAAQLASALLIHNPRSNLYAYFFLLTEPVLWVFYVLVVLELYSLVLEQHRGLFTAGRWALYGSL